MRDLAALRERMVERQIAARGVRDLRVLQAMRTVPREAFVPPGLEEFAYDDAPLPIGFGQTISQPYIVALMAEAARIGSGDRVLDVGTGSGYGAAVLAELAREVYTIERHPGLAEAARERLVRAGYGGVHTCTGDGTAGWPEAAPFDAIIVAAGGPQVPDSLRRQLAIGGRLVVPVGAARRHQSLLRVVRTGEDAYESEDLGGVAFVPLIGEEGWDPEPNAGDGGPRGSGRVPRRSAGRVGSAARAEPVELVAAAAEPAPDPGSEAFGALFDRAGGARVVLLGEATHGTSEFYRARAQITRRLIERHGFNIVAVEADWPDAARINRYVRHLAPGPAEEPAFDRFPTWMWRNVEVAEFVEWLREHNGARADPARRTGFYGLDLYSLYGSIGAVLGYLGEVDPGAAAIARERYGCLTPWQQDPAAYGGSVLTARYRSCAAEVTSMLQDLLRKRLEYSRADGESFLDAERNARLVAAAERYYRIMYYGSAESWNHRDRHMFETLESVLAARGPDAKAVVWAHNSHVGNAAATEMGIVREELNVGQLCRERFGGEALLVGFGTDRGTVAAADDWDEPMRIKSVRPAHPESYEHLCHGSGIERFVLDLRAERNEPVHRALLAPRLERAIGVIYRPESELASHYFEASLPRQFDLWVWFDETRAVTPLTLEAGHGMPETWPFGL